jgi:hypothetical protein
MSELGNIRPIPSRSFSPSFISSQEIIKPVSSSWVPRYTFENSSVKVKFGAGVVNGFLPGNWDKEFLIPQSNERYAKLEVSATINGINSVKIIVESDPKIENKFNKNYPPTKFTFLIGVLKGTSYSMTFNGPITVTPAEAFKEPIEDPKPGEQPFTRYWHWVVG